MPILQSRILCILHNIPARMFRAFEVKVFNMEVSQLIAHFESEDDEQRLIELLQQLTRLSSHLVYSAMKVRFQHVLILQ